MDYGLRHLSRVIGIGLEKMLVEQKLLRPPAPGSRYPVPVELGGDLQSDLGELRIAVVSDRYTSKHRDTGVCWLEVNLKIVSRKGQR